MPPLIHEFTPDEKRVIDEARGRLIYAMEVIARCHGIYDQIAMSPDGRGLIKPQVEMLNA